MTKSTTTKWKLAFYKGMALVAVIAAVAAPRKWN